MLIQHGLLDHLKKNPEIILDQKNVLQMITDYRPDVPIPKAFLHQLTAKQLRKMHGQSVIVRMMVQDIHETELYAGAIFKQNKLNSLIINKYWPQNTDHIDHEEYEHVLMERQVYHLTSIRGENDWLKDYRHDSREMNQAVLRAYDGQNYKIGHIINIIALVDFDTPEEYEDVDAEPGDLTYHYPLNIVPRLNLVRELTKEEIRMLNLDVEEEITRQEIDFMKVRQEMLEVMNKFCSPRYSQMLLYSFFGQGNNSMFLTGENIYEFIRQIVPYSVYLGLKLPLKEKIFPYKQHILHNTPLQLSEKITYIMFDFTELGAGTIGQEEIDNLKSIKTFVEDNKTLYKWEVGSSLFNNNCSGIVAKASTIVKPTFNLKNEKVNPQLIPKMSEEQLWRFRRYIVKCREIFMKNDISVEVQEKLTKSFVNERQKEGGDKISGQVFSSRILIGKFKAASLGRDKLELGDYEEAMIMLEGII